MSARWVIAGAGPAGLSLARAFARHGLDFRVYERHDDVGGIWNHDNPGTPIYRSAHFISSKTQSGYLGFPMPAHYPDYPGARLILEYHRAFAEAYDLRRHVRFGCGVAHAEPDDKGGWQVRLDSGETVAAAGLVCATGVTWDPNLPDYPGRFDGEIRHAVTYRDAGEFAGRRVLVVGGGNSACDIACDAAQAADAALISLRRGYHFIPKHLFGVPADEFAESGPPLPMWITQPLFGALLRLLVGDLTRLGLQKPDHRLFETHPILNDQLLHHLRHGDIAARPDVERFDGPEVVFTDGRRDRVDLVILATGYRQTIPYIPADAMEWSGSRPQLYLNLFSRRQPALMAMGYMETDGGAYRMFDRMADAIAQHARDRIHAPERARRLDRLKARRPDLSGGVKYLPTERHANYVNHRVYLKALAALVTEMGWSALQPHDLSPEGHRRATAAAPPPSRSVQAPQDAP